MPNRSTTAFIGILRARFHETITSDCFIQVLKRIVTSECPINPLEYDPKCLESETTYSIYHELLQELLANDDLDWIKIKCEAQDSLRLWEESEKQQAITKEETRLPFKCMSFVPIPKGHIIGRNGVSIEISYDFELQETPITQYQWYSVMKENPSLIEGRKELINWESIGISTPMLPDYPVDSITIEQIIGSYQNKITGLKVTSSEYKNLIKKEQCKYLYIHGFLDEIEQLIKRKKHRHILNDDGRLKMIYRLPTRDESIYVLLKALAGDFRQSVNNTNHSITNEELVEHSLLCETTRMNNESIIYSQKVCEQKAFFVGENSLYDLFGNVWEITQDYVSKDTGIRQYRVRGGCSTTSAASVEDSIYEPVKFDYGHPAVGFRLVRVSLA